jgi:hypothetical protein
VLGLPLLLRESVVNMAGRVAFWLVRHWRGGRARRPPLGGTGD